MARFITSIPAKSDYHQIMTRLGYKRRTAEVPDAFLSEVKSYIDETSSLLNLKASAERLKILEKTEEYIILDITGKIRQNTESSDLSGTDKKKIFTIESRSLANFLKDAGEVLIMAVCGGKEVADAVEDIQGSNMTKAVVIDAAAGEITDDALDYVMSLYRRELLRESKKLLPKRFSPGYGDLDLEIQKVIYDILYLEKIGITLTDSFMMIPQKSVIALTGII